MTLADIFTFSLPTTFEKTKHGTKTFVTTNLTIEKLESYYGQRVADRLYEMFNFIELGGSSRRFQLGCDSKQVGQGLHPYHPTCPAGLTKTFSMFQSK